MVDYFDFLCKLSVLCSLSVGLYVFLIDLLEHFIYDALIFPIFSHFLEFIVSCNF